VIQINLFCITCVSYRLGVTQCERCCKMYPKTDGEGWWPSDQFWPCALCGVKFNFVVIQNPLHEERCLAFIERHRAEVQRLAGLATTEAEKGEVVTIYDCDNQEGLPYYGMDMAESENESVDEEDTLLVAAAEEAEAEAEAAVGEPTMEAVLVLDETAGAEVTKLLGEVQVVVVDGDEEEEDEDAAEATAEEVARQEYMAAERAIRVTRERGDIQRYARYIRERGRKREKDLLDRV